MAPDGNRVFCQKKFDIWACGVTMHLLFTGKLPAQQKQYNRTLIKTHIEGISD